MFINSTKTTLNAPKIAICSNDDEGFFAIQKIVQLFRWLNINTTFEVFEIAGKQYEKGLQYGISEPDLVRLKQTNILIHTKFDEHLKTKNTISQIEYLNIAMRNYFIKNVYQNNKQDINDCFFYQQHKEHIKNIYDFDKYKTSNKNTAIQMQQNLQFTLSFGEKYAIFSLYDYSDETILSLMNEFLSFANIEKNIDLLKYQDIKTAINELKKQYKEIPTIIEKFNYTPKIEYKTELQIFNQNLTKNETKFNGLFSVKQIVSAIKEKQVKIPDEMEIDKIIADNIEVYPNIAFWDDNVLNPTIILRKEII